ncbi:MAG: hypothetical protein NW226_23955 [Microscillaceae bacterium]|nr:hypothetical protein [Microscillaceae bacterium]
MGCEGTAQGDWKNQNLYIMKKITLFHLKTSVVETTHEIYFSAQGHLCFEGYDTGKIVEEYKGDSDYEYFYTVKKEEVKKLSQVFNLPQDDQSRLLEAIWLRFGNHQAYSQLGEFMRVHDIKFDSFTW